MAADNANLAALYKGMSEKVVQIEQLALELREMGQELPVIQQNTRAILAFTHALRFGVIDPAQVLED